MLMFHFNITLKQLKIRFKNDSFFMTNSQLFLLKDNRCFEFKRRCIEWSVYDVKFIRKHRNHLLSFRSRGTLMSYTDHSMQHRLKSNTPNNFIHGALSDFKCCRMFSFA